MGIEHSRSVDHTTGETHLRRRRVLDRIGGRASTGVSVVLAPTSLFIAATELALDRPIVAGIIFGLGEATALTLGVIGSRLRNKAKILDFQTGKKKVRKELTVNDLRRRS